MFNAVHGGLWMEIICWALGVAALPQQRDIHDQKKEKKRSSIEHMKIGRGKDSKAGKTAMRMKVVSDFMNAPIGGQLAVDSSRSMEIQVELMVQHLRVRRGSKNPRTISRYVLKQIDKIKEEQGWTQANKDESGSVPASMPSAQKKQPSKHAQPTYKNKAPAYR